MLTKKELVELSKVHDAFCVSIFIPTHRAGKDPMTGKDEINLKNQIQDVKNKLEAQGMQLVEIEKFMQPVDDLLLSKTFWRNQSDGLAVFLSDDFFKAYTVPVHFEAFNYLSNEFYLKPLMPLFNGDGLFYLLAISTDRTRLFEGTRHTITEIQVDDIVPGQLEDVVGYDYEQKSLQFRSQQGANNGTIFHGHGQPNAKEKDEIKRYFREIDKGIMQLLHEDQHPPLLLACVDYHYPIYEEVNSYQHLYPEHIRANPSDMDPYLLHEKAWNILEDYFNQNKKEKLDKFMELNGTGKTSTRLEEIVPAALDGKVDTLFLENKADVFGTYDPKTRELRVRQNKKAPNVSLLNLAATRVLEQGGKVYILEKEEIPEGFHEATALYRY